MGPGRDEAAGALWAPKEEKQLRLSQSPAHGSLSPGPPAGLVLQRQGYSWPPPAAKQAAALGPNGSFGPPGAAAALQPQQQQQQAQQQQAQQQAQQAQQQAQQAQQPQRLAQMPAETEALLQQIHRQHLLRLQQEQQRLEEASGALGDASDEEEPMPSPLLSVEMMDAEVRRAAACLFVFTVCFSAWIMLTQTHSRRAGKRGGWPAGHASRLFGAASGTVVSAWVEGCHQNEWHAPRAARNACMAARPPCGLEMCCASGESRGCRRGAGGQLCPTAMVFCSFTQ